MVFEVTCSEIFATEVHIIPPWLKLICVSHEALFHTHYYYYYYYYYYYLLLLLNWLYIVTYLKRALFLGCITLQLFYGYHVWYIYCYFAW